MVEDNRESRTEVANNSSRIKREFRQIITDIHQATEEEGKGSQSQPQPRKPSILGKKGETKEEYSLSKNEFSNPFEEFNKV